jgi:RNA polymerase sigma-70 factor (ECF subfamily)
MPDAQVLPMGGDPAALAEARETIRLAFLAALQHLPPRQRAVLILREVLRWSAAEVAELLGSTVASVNSALQRARATLEASDLEAADVAPPEDAQQKALLARYVEAFERYDMDSLVSLLHEDATWSMPPYAPGRPRRHPRLVPGPGAACRGSRLVPTTANGPPAFGQYRVAADGHGHEPWSLQVLEISEGRITGVTFFLDTANLFPVFGLPARLEPLDR